MVFGGFIPVDVHKSHEHEYDYVASISTQDAHPVEMVDRHEEIMGGLRNQYYNQNADVDKRNISNTKINGKFE